MTRHVCVTAVEGNTGFLIAELLVTDENFKKQVNSVTGLAMNHEHERCKELAKLGVTIVPHRPGRVRDMVNTIKHCKADTMCLIPPAHRDKVDITAELIEATKRANVPNSLLISSAGCDLAERDKQPRLREFIDLEAMMMETKGNPSTATGTSPVIIRAGFYAENLLLYAPQAQEEGILPLPIGKHHQFAPVALGDVALLAAHVLAGKGPKGFSDQHRGQLMVMTGPKLLSGDLIAKDASKALGVDMKFEDVSEREAKRVLRHNYEGDDAEIDYLLEYYSLVREGKTNYIATTAFHDVTGDHPQEPPDFFKVYTDEFSPKRGVKRRKTDGK